MVKVLLVEDDEEDYILTRELLREARGDFILDWVSTYREALEEIEKSKHDVYLVDYRLGEMDGLDLLRTAIDMGCKAPLIILTGVGDLNLDMAAAETGAADYLVKNNLSPELLERSIRYSLEQKRNEALLCKAGERLESQVAVRTAELSEVNRRLHAEIEGRKLKEQELMARER